MTKKPEPVPSWLDLDGNGVPDYQEAWFLRGAWRVAVFVVRMLAPSNTIVRRGVELIELERGRVP